MTRPVSHDVGQQRLAALQMANAARQARARLKRQVASGAISVVELLRDPPSAADRCSVAELLMSQRHWGRIRSVKLLTRVKISETKLVSDLTERQRRLLAVQLERVSVQERDPGEP